jgi:hypothetical protein
MTTRHSLFFFEEKAFMDQNKNAQHSEGPVASMIETQTAKLPSDLFLWSSLSAMVASATLYCLGKKHSALFVGQWAAPFLLLGLYKKQVKIGGQSGVEGNARRHKMRLPRRKTV